MALLSMCCYDTGANQRAPLIRQTLESLLNISGVGQVKLKQYGEAFLEVIVPYCKKRKLAEKTPERAEKAPAREKSESSQRFMVVGEAYNAGESVQSLVDRYNVKLGTILDHLAAYARAGNKLRNGAEFQEWTSTTPEQQKAAFRAFEELGTDYLKPVFERLGGSVNYDELKILRVCYLSL